jgi:uncharacterized Fe-S radical SAM superfamily protein PflX
MTNEYKLRHWEDGSIAECSCCGFEVPTANHTTFFTKENVLLCMFCRESFIGRTIEGGPVDIAMLAQSIAHCFNILLRELRNPTPVVESVFIADSDSDPS